MLIYTHKEVLRKALKQTGVIYDYPRKFIGQIGLDVAVTKEGEIHTWEVNECSCLQPLINANPKKRSLDITEDMLNLIGVHVTLDGKRVINPQYGEDNKDIYRFKAPKEFSHTLEQLIKRRKNGGHLDVKKLTAFEKRAYMQILDEQTRIGPMVRLKFEDHLDEFEKPTYLTELVYQLLKDGVKL